MIRNDNIKLDMIEPNVDDLMLKIAIERPEP
jgi:hypothetical protein